jgi:hypothetical protein
MGMAANDKTSLGTGVIDQEKNDSSRLPCYSPRITNDNTPPAIHVVEATPGVINKQLEEEGNHDKS